LHAWEPDLAEVRARYEALDAGDFGSAVEHACEWRPADPFSGFFLPLPPVAQELFSAHGSWRLGDGAPHERPDSVALDASGRPVAHVLERSGDFERAKHLWWWDEDGSLLEIELMGSGPHVRRARAIDGRWAHIATVSASVDEIVQTLTWRDGRAVRADIAGVYLDGGGWASARTAEFDADGRLLRIREIRDRCSGEIPACLEQAAALVPEEVVWDARVHSPEAWPGDEAALARAAPLAAALDRALRVAAAEADVIEPFLLEVFTAERRNALFPPIARLHSAQWRDRMRRSSSQDGAALFGTHKAANAGLAPDLGLADHLDEEALRTCRMLSSAYHAGSPRSLQSAADPVADAIGDELALSLNAEPLAGAADPFLAAVFIGGRHRTGDRFDRIRSIVGRKHFARFLASVGSTKPRGGAARQLREQARRALTDRDALEALLADGGLPAHATALAHQIAEPGLLLLPAGDTPARSRLGGPPLLPAGQSWPDPLTFVAGIDLTELPPSALPVQGWLLFFLDFGTGDGDGLTGEAPNQPGSPARLFWTENAVAATGPSLNPRPVTAHPYLTLPDDWTAGQLLSLDVYDRETYAELAERLAAALPRRQSRHWLGGYVTGVQGEPLDRETTLLLSLEEDGDLGFSFLDAGTVQFRIPPDALAQHDFARAITFGDSG
jgi:uncharacterized protein YwqG